MDGWESGIQFLGPPRFPTLRRPLTRVDHPERLWELRLLESHLPPIGNELSVQIKIGAAELSAVVGGVLSFAVWSIVAQARERLASRSYLAWISDRRGRP